LPAQGRCCHRRWRKTSPLPDAVTVPTVKGSGKWQTSLLAALDGQPPVAREVVQEILGRPPSPSEYNACHRAVRLLIDRGQLTGWLLPGQLHLLVVRKVHAWYR
jgi:hypothetical protein